MQFHYCEYGVKVISEFVPKDITELSEIILRSSPILASITIPTPPATVNAPSVAFVFAVAEILTTPPEEIAIASVSDAEPIVPASSIISDQQLPLLLLLLNHQLMHL